MTTSPNRFLDRRISNHDCETETGCCSTCRTHDGCSCDASAAPDLDVLAGLLAEATPGPWIVDSDYEVIAPDPDPIAPDWPYTFVITDCNGQASIARRDMALIAAAVNALPALIAAARERDALVAEVESLVEWSHKGSLNQRRDSQSRSVLSFVRDRLRAALAPTPGAERCTTCAGTGLVDWAPGEARHLDTDQQPCPDCPGAEQEGAE